MRTFLVIVVGVALAVAFDLAAAAYNRRGRNIDGGRWFIWAWLVFALADFGVGVAAGHGALLELAIHALVFAVPAAVAWHLSRRRRAPSVPE
jgi:hypothetical protein